MIEPASLRPIQMGRLPPPFKGGNAQSITFCVTEDCNLRCKYCYMTEKNCFHRMTFEVAKKAVDFFLEQPPKEPSVIWEFIGGEPTLEMDLIDKVSDYIKMQMYIKSHPWFNSYIFSICTNGLLYNSTAVQTYISKNQAHLSIAVTIDGTKEKHDLQRVYPNGKGSYNDVRTVIPLWRKQFPGTSTKVTFSSRDLIYLKDSIIHLWNMGIKNVPANVVFEDVWKEGDDVLFEKQLKELADYIISNELWADYSVRFFDPTVGFPLGKKAKEHTFCGTGKMIAVDAEGSLYPCVRFIDFCNVSQQEKPALKTGSIFTKINEGKRKIVQSTTIGILNNGECVQCPVASGCFSCSACNYNYSKIGTIFARTKFHCALQKAQVRANDYFWDKFSHIVKEVTPRELERLYAYEREGWRMDGGKYLLFIIDPDGPSHCIYPPAKVHTKEKMKKELFLKGLHFAHANYMIPVFLGDPGDMLPENEGRKLHVLISTPAENFKQRSCVEKYIPIFDENNYTADDIASMCIYKLHKNIAVEKTLYGLRYLSKKHTRINIIPEDINHWESKDFRAYQCLYDEIRNNGAFQKTLSIF